MAKNLKIVTIGPYPPFRGGISDFHKSIVKQLKINNDVTVINFKSLYPSILFPGKSQVTNHNNSYKSARILNPINLFSWIKSIKILKDYNPDVVFISYWHPFFAPMYNFIIKRILSKKIYLLLHNVISHQSLPFEKFFMKKVLSHKNCKYIVMNSSDRKKALKINETLNLIDNFHPIYNQDFNSNDREIFRTELSLTENNVILFFGLIRPHKGLDILIDAISLIKNDIKNLKVLIIGEAYEDMTKYSRKIESLNLSDLFVFNQSFVEEKNISKYFLSSDLVVLPYKSSTQSGVLSLAMNFNKPVIVSSEGGLKDYVEDEKTGFISLPKAVEFANKIKKYFNSEIKNQMEQNIKERKKSFSWSSFEERLKIYDE